MGNSKRGVFLGAVYGALFLAGAGTASAGPLSVAVPQEIGPPSLVQEVSHFGPPPGKQCIKWTRRFNSRHGYGHRRCVHWK
jgi:hypothetical protein